jgi:hypothetical protein
MHKNYSLSVNTLVILACCFSPVNATDFFTDQHSIWCGGNFSFSNIVYDNNSTKTITSTPFLRYFPGKFVFVGTRFQWIGMYRSYGYSGNTYKDNTLGYGLELGGAFGKNERVIPYFNVGIQFDVYKSESPSQLIGWDPYTGQPIYESGTFKEQGRTLPMSFGIIAPVLGVFAVQVETGFQIRWQDGNANVVNIFSVSLGFCAVGKKVAVSGLSTLGSAYF